MKFILALPGNMSSLTGIALELSSLFNNIQYARPASLEYTETVDALDCSISHNRRLS